MPARGREPVVCAVGNPEGPVARAAGCGGNGHALATLPGRATVDEAAEAVVRTLQHDFPILDDQGDVRGILTRDGIIKALKRGEGTAPVQDIMHRDVPTVRSDDAFEHAFRLMEEHSSPALPVVDGDGRPVGLITPENVGETMMLCSSRADARLAERRGEHREITHRREAMPPAEPTREQEAP